MKPKLLSVVAFVGVVFAVIWCWPRHHVSRIGVLQTVRGKVVPAVQVEPARAVIPPSAIVGYPPKEYLDWTEFCAKFDVNQVEWLDLRGELFTQAKDWNEEKGLGAEVVSLDGQVLKIHIPSLGLTEDRARRVLGQRLVSLLGEKRIQAISGDPEGWQTLLFHTRFDELNFDTTYTITRTKDEDLKQPAGFGNASFNATIINRTGSPKPARQHGDINMLLQGADINRLGDADFLGWNAMAKIPAGYIRTAPILGVASRPAPMVVVINNLDTDTAEIRNLQGDGSTETVKIGDPMPTGP